MLFQSEDGKRWATIKIHPITPGMNAIAQDNLPLLKSTINGEENKSITWNWNQQKSGSWLMILLIFSISFTSIVILRYFGLLEGSFRVLGALALSWGPPRAQPLQLTSSWVWCDCECNWENLPILGDCQNISANAKADGCWSKRKSQKVSRCFCLMACLKRNELSKSMWPLKRYWNILQNLSNRDSSSIRLEVTIEQTWYMLIRPIQLAFPHPYLPPQSWTPKRMAAVVAAEGGVTKYQCIEIILLKKLSFTIGSNQRMNLHFIM